MKRTTKALLIAVALTVSKTAIVSACSGRSSVIEAYRSLSAWDSLWYQHIMEMGYRSTNPPVAQNANLANVGFFPAYPVISGWIRALFRLDGTSALLLSAQLESVLFWFYVIAFLMLWESPPLVAAAAIAAIWVHPAAFYLSAAYSEPLFLATLLGFMYWSLRSIQGRANPAGDKKGSGRKVGHAFALAALHGFTMTATRLVGLPLVVYPVVVSWLDKMPRKTRALKDWAFRRWRLFALSFAASLGALSFFAFCQLKFGNWKLYFDTQRIGWRNQADYLAIFDWRIYVPYSGYLPKQDWDGLFHGNPWAISEIFVPITVLAFLALLAVDWRISLRMKASRWKERAPFYFMGGLLFYVTLSGLKSSFLGGMARYSFCCHVLFILATAHLATQVRQDRKTRSSRVVRNAKSASMWLSPAALGAALIPIGIALFLLQLYLAWRHTHSLYVT